MLNKIMLITYPDSMGHDLKDLHHILNLYFKDAVKWCISCRFSFQWGPWFCPVRI